MKSFLAAAFAATALSAACAGAASAQTARIPFGDLDLSTAAGAAAFDVRIERAVHRMCRNATRTGSRLSDRDHCAAAVRAEALAQLPTASRREYAMARLPRVEA